MENYWKQIDVDGNMFDFENFYTRIAEILPDNCIVAEIGVSNGKSALCLAAKLKERNKQFSLIMIDSLQYGGDSQKQTIINNIINSGLQDNIQFLALDSLNASSEYPDRHFDFVYIDASHEYEKTKADIRLWSHKVKKDGILGGHDYIEGNPVSNAVKEVVPAGILNVEDTDHHWGLWWYKKDNYMNLIY